MDEIQYWKVKAQVIKASSYAQTRSAALELFAQVESQTKRKPYIRSKYFQKKKVFLHHFWAHLFQKNPKDRTRRLKFIGCAFELIKQTTYPPETVLSTKKGADVWFRFYGICEEEQKFAVQIKQSRNGHLYFLSVFPRE